MMLKGRKNQIPEVLILPPRLVLHLQKCHVLDSSGPGGACVGCVCSDSLPLVSRQLPDKTKALDRHLGTRRVKHLGLRCTGNVPVGVRLTNKQIFFETVISMCSCSLSCMQIRPPCCTITNLITVGFFS